MVIRFHLGSIFVDLVFSLRSELGVRLGKGPDIFCTSISERQPSSSIKTGDSFTSPYKSFWSVIMGVESLR